MKTASWEKKGGNVYVYDDESKNLITALPVEIPIENFRLRITRTYNTEKQYNTYALCKRVVAALHDLGIATVAQLLAEIKQNRKVISEVIDINWTSGMHPYQIVEFAEILYKQDPYYLDGNVSNRLLMDLNDPEYTGYVVLTCPSDVTIPKDFNKKLPGFLTSFIQKNSQQFILDALKEVHEEEVKVTKEALEQARQNLKSLEKHAKVSSVS